MVLYGSIIRIIPSKIVFESSLSEKSVDIGESPSMDSFVDICG